MIVTRTDRWIHGASAEDLFDEMLDECYPPIKIGTLEYSPSWVMKNVDPIEYRCGVSDYEDSCCEEE